MWQIYALGTKDEHLHRPGGLFGILETFQHAGHGLGSDLGERGMVLRCSLIFVPGESKAVKKAEKLREGTKFDEVADEGKGRLSHSRDKNQGEHRRRRVGQNRKKKRKKEPP